MKLTATKVIDYVRRDFDASHALRVISDACDGDCYLVGGVVRDSVLIPSYFGDLDIMVPNGDLRAYEALNELGVPYEVKRLGNRRYHWNYRQIDIFEPKGFYVGFSSLENALKFFDFKINALAVHLRSGRFLDPLDGADCLARHEVAINWHRWNSPDMSTDDIWILLIRLARILHNAPSLSLSGLDAQGLGTVLARINQATFERIRHRFPPGKSDLIGIIEDILLRRVKEPQ